MNIISGLYKGKNLYSLNTMDIRPTTNRVKEALFNILQNEVYNCDFLDLFGGIGSIACEATSRGAKTVTCVDNMIDSIKTIKKNNALVENKINIVKSDVINFLNNSNQQYDIIFMDPPYKLDIEELKKINKIIFESKLLRENGYLVIEFVQELPNDFGDFSKTMTRKYGKSYLNIFRR